LILNDFHGPAMRTELTDGTIIIRQFQSQDAESLYSAVRSSIPEISLWMPWCHAEYSVEESRSWVDLQDDLWDNGQQFNFVITDNEGSYLGGVGLNAIDQHFHCGNLGYWIRSDAAGRGVAVAAALLCLQFAFEDVKLTRVEVIVDAENTRSLRVAEKLGAQREGLLRNRVPVNGQRRDAVLFSLLPDDGI
jgi:ribosomal-protein-serine acetyltransferase